MNIANPFEKIENKTADVEDIPNEFKICIEGLQKTVGDREILNLCRSMGNVVNGLKLQRVQHTDSVFVYFKTLT